MRIRTALLAALLLAGLLPFVGLTWLTYDRGMKRELADVTDRHLLLAKNLSFALSRYEKDVRATVSAIAIGLREGADFASPDLMDALHIGSIATVDPTTGEIVASKIRMVATHMMPSAEEMLVAMSDMRGLGLTFSPVQQEPAGNRIQIMGWVDDTFVVACINTGYFQNLGSQIAFGDKGHAAIVDQNGRALSHPRKDWTDSAKDMSRISAVQRMMNGETGVETFYSPALKADMIAGLTSVAGPGWGVMIPQPVSELHNRALLGLLPFMIGLVVLLGVFLLLTRQALRSFAMPLEVMVAELNRQIANGMPAPVAPLRRNRDIYELVQVVDAYNTLAANAQRSAETLEERAHQDPVTNIGNRAYFMEKGAAQICQRMALSRRGMLIYIDLDGFKEINDTHGHGHGDAVLRAFAAQLYTLTKSFMDREFRGITGAHPIIGRIGGDEFAILLPLPAETEDLTILVERLRKSMPDQVTVDGAKLKFGISAGGAIYPEQGSQIEDLLRRADVALYSAKQHGRSRFCLYNSNNALGGKSEILQSVSQAIATDEMELHYQPKFCLTTKSVNAVEALVRWNHPEMGTISPDMFLPAIQNTQAMAALGEWAVDRAITDMRNLDEKGIHLNVAVNIGTEHFCQEGFAGMLAEICAEREFETSRMQVEVTEDVVDQTTFGISSTVQSVQAAGFTVAIDDFGKGFSNLSRLATFPADVLKLDRSLTAGAVEDQRQHSLLRTAVMMGHALGSRVIIEGVETAEEVALATAAGADALQGYHIARPMPADALADWLSNRHSSPQHKLLHEVRTRSAA